MELGRNIALIWAWHRPAGSDPLKVTWVGGGAELSELSCKLADPGLCAAWVSGRPNPFRILATIKLPSYKGCTAQGGKKERLEGCGHCTAGTSLGNGIKGILTSELDFYIFQIVYDSHVLIL